MLPAGPGGGDGEVVHVGLGGDGRGRNLEVDQVEAGQGALHQLRDAFGRAQFDELRGKAQQVGLRK